MSVWSSVEAVIIMDRNSGCSVKTLIEEIFPEAEPKAVQHGYNRIHIVVNFTFSEEGVAAAMLIKKFIDAIESYDKTATIDLQADIRFIR